jgi:glycosyltransferase involved in cell wall biosynthesis
MVAAAERAQALIAVSEALAVRMERLGMPADRLNVLRNGVDAKQFAPYERTAARHRLGLETQWPLVLGVGNLVLEKGFDLLVRAVALLPETRLLIVGEGPKAKELHKLAAALGPGRVAFRANMPQAELRFAYAAADLLALPSLREGWPNVVLESLSCGTPVVATPLPGLSRVPGVTLADDISAEALAARIAALLDARPVLPTADVEAWMAQHDAPAVARRYDEVLSALSGRAFVPSEVH